MNNLNTSPYPRCCILFILLAFQLIAGDTGNTIPLDTNGKPYTCME